MNPIQVRPYPSKETLQKNLQDKVNWTAYKQDVVQSVILARAEKSDGERPVWKNKPERFLPTNS